MDCLKSDGDPYTVFTPFYKNAVKLDISESYSKKGQFAESAGNESRQMLESLPDAPAEIRGPFKPIKTPSQVGYRLSVATWPDESQAFDIGELPLPAFDYLPGTRALREL